MKWLFTDILLMGIIALIILITSITLSTKIDEWHWFQRSGAVLVLIGGILSSRKIIRKGFKDLFKDAVEMSGGSYVPTDEEINEKKQLKIDIRAAKIGVALLLIGTLIWAFGDLLARIL